MRSYVKAVFAFTVLGSALAAPPSPYSKPFEHLKRQANASTSGLTVDLGYEVYDGYHNSTANINYWNGQAGPCENCKYSRLTFEKHSLRGTPIGRVPMAATAASNIEPKPSDQCERVRSNMSPKSY